MVVSKSAVEFIQGEGLEAFWRKRLEFAKVETQDPMIIARAYASAGEVEEALRHLELAYQERHTFLVFDLKNHPQWDCLRHQPRIIKLLKRLNLD